MSDVIDSMAKAMAEVDAVMLTSGAPWPWEQRSKTAQVRFRKMARAALGSLGLQPILTATEDADALVVNLGETFLEAVERRCRELGLDDLLPKVKDADHE